MLSAERDGGHRVLTRVSQSTFFDSSINCFSDESVTCSPVHLFLPQISRSVVFAGSHRCVNACL